MKNYNSDFFGESENVDHKWENSTHDLRPECIKKWELFYKKKGEKEFRVSESYIHVDKWRVTSPPVNIKKYSPYKK